MKKNSISRFYTLLSVTLVFSLVSLQSSSQDLIAVMHSPAKTHTGTSLSTKTPAAVTAKVMDSFKRSFAGIENPFWEVSNNVYYAHFQSGDRSALAAFSKNGRINYTILYGTEKHLPAFVKSVVQSNYPDYVVTATQYIVKYNVGTWLVTLENNKEIYKVKVNGDDVYLVEHMKRAK
jgi:hypothetical protein